MLGDLPAGRLVARFGERRAIIVGSAIGAAGVLLSAAAWTPSVLAVGAVLTGLSTAVVGSGPAELSGRDRTGAHAGPRHGDVRPDVAVGHAGRAVRRGGGHSADRPARRAGGAVRGRAAVGLSAHPGARSGARGRCDAGRRIGRERLDPAPALTVHLGVRFAADGRRTGYQGCARCRCGRTTSVWPPRRCPWCTASVPVSICCVPTPPGN